MNKTLNLFIIIFLTILCFHSYCTDKPVIAVMEFTRSSTGVKEDDVRLLVDLLNHTLMDTGFFHVIGKRERTRLLHVYEYSNKYLREIENFKEIGEKLFADYLIGGKIMKEKNKMIFTVFVFDVSGVNLPAEQRHEYDSIIHLLEDCRSITELITGYIREIHEPGPLAPRIMENLSPVIIKERLLFILQKENISSHQEDLRKLGLAVLSLLLKNERFLLYTTEFPYNEEKPDYTLLQEIREEWDCHYFAVIEIIVQQWFFSVYTITHERVLSIPLNTGDFSTAAAPIAAAIEERLPLLEIPVLSKEIDDAIALEKRLDELLFSEQLLSRNFVFTLHQTFLKPAMLYIYLPKLTSFSLEGTFYWYNWYNNRMIGSGIGYGYTLNQPETFAENFYTHASMHQHEIRLIPFSLRTGGRASFIINLFSTLNFHNISQMEAGADADEVIFDNDEKEIIIFSKIGINMGLFYNFSQTYAFYWHGIGINYAIKINDPYNYDDSNYADIRPFSGELGGLGLAIRF